MPSPLLRQVETTDGNINVVIGECWAALFPKESAEQVKFLIEHVNLLQKKEE